MDDVAARSDSATESLQQLYEATAAEVLSRVTGWVPSGVVDDVVVGTYRYAWQTAARRPARAPVQGWLDAIALTCARQLLTARRGVTSAGC